MGVCLTRLFQSKLIILPFLKMKTAQVSRRHEVGANVLVLIPVDM